MWNIQSPVGRLIPDEVKYVEAKVVCFLFVDTWKYVFYRYILKRTQIFFEALLLSALHCLIRLIFSCINNFEFI
jgi:hypothetical protein